MGNASSAAAPAPSQLSPASALASAARIFTPLTAGNAVKYMCSGAIVPISSSSSQTKKQQEAYETQVKDITEATQAVLDRFRRKNKIKFNRIRIFCRPTSSGVSDNSAETKEDSKSSDGNVLLAANGIFHTMVILDTDDMDYFVDRVVQGIRLRAIDVDIKADKELKSRFAFNVITEDIDFKVSDFVQFMESEMKKEYSLLQKNCIHFACDLFEQCTGETITHIRLARLWNGLCPDIQLGVV